MKLELCMPVYVVAPDGGPTAALVTRVHDSECINVFVMHADSGSETLTFVRHDPSGKEPGSWHFPFEPQQQWLPLLGTLPGDELETTAASVSTAHETESGNGETQPPAGETATSPSETPPAGGEAAPPKTEVPPADQSSAAN